MSKITNDGLRHRMLCSVSIVYPYGNSGCQRVNLVVVDNAVL